MSQSTLKRCNRRFPWSCTPQICTSMFQESPEVCPNVSRCPTCSLFLVHAALYIDTPPRWWGVPRNIHRARRGRTSFATETPIASATGHLPATQIHASTRIAPHNLSMRLQPKAPECARRMSCGYRKTRSERLCHDRQAQRPDSDGDGRAKPPQIKL